MTKKKYVVSARRDAKEKWTAWLTTTNRSLVSEHIRAIRHYGWQCKINVKG